MNESIDLSAQIIPGRSAGGVFIGARLSALYPKLKYLIYSNRCRTLIEDPFYVRYEVTNAFSLVVHVLNGRIIKLGCLKNYIGRLSNGICVGMTIGEAQSLNSSIYFDDNNEQFRFKGVPGIALESKSSTLSGAIEAITVYSPALESWNQEKERGEWQ
jgi:hypothetical protein